VTLLFAKYAREVAKALPSNQAYLLRGSEKRTVRASNGLALGLISGFGLADVGTLPNDRFAPNSGHSITAHYANRQQACTVQSILKNH
jgi:hypothetical protein